MSELCELVTTGTLWPKGLIRGTTYMTRFWRSSPEDLSIWLRVESFHHVGRMDLTNGSIDPTTSEKLEGGFSITTGHGQPATRTFELSEEGWKRVGALMWAGGGAV